jgi:hypothetical protein
MQVSDVPASLPPCGWGESGANRAKRHIASDRSTGRGVHGSSRVGPDDQYRVGGGVVEALEGPNVPIYGLESIEPFVHRLPSSR